MDFDETPRTETDTVVSGEISVPHRWSSLLFGFAGTLVVVLVLAALVVWYLQSRPVDLRGITLGAYEEIGNILAYNRVPGDLIEVTPQTVVHEDGAVWIAFSFDVVLPDDLSLEGMAKLIRENLRDRYVLADVVSSDNAHVSLELSVAEHAFAELRLRQPTDLLAPLEPDTGETPAQPVLPTPEELEARVQARHTEASPVEPPEAENVVVDEPSDSDPPDAQQDVVPTVALDVPVAQAAPDSLFKPRSQPDELPEVEVPITMPRALIGEGEGDMPPVPAEEVEEERPLVSLPEAEGAAPEPAVKAADGITEAPLEESALTEEYADVDYLEAPQSSDHPADPAPATVPEMADPTDEATVPEMAEPTDEAPVPESAEPSDEAPVPESAEPTDEATVPRIAIIVDDGGYGGDTSDAILSLDPQLTLSIFPDASNSAETAERAVQLGFEVMLHVPMENNRPTPNAFPNQLTTWMNQDQIRAFVEEATYKVPGLSGMNNHEGSKLTADADAMRMLMTAIKEKGLYFIDSRTTADTVAYDIAKEMGVRTAKRDIFLDNRSDPDYIRGQFEHLFEKARKQGSAIGICHFRTKTVPVLAEMLKTLAAQGIQLVHASELVQ